MLRAKACGIRAANAVAEIVVVEEGPFVNLSLIAGFGFGDGFHKAGYLSTQNVGVNPISQSINQRLMSGADCGLELRCGKNGLVFGAGIEGNVGLCAKIFLPQGEKLIQQGIYLGILRGDGFNAQYVTVGDTGTEPVVGETLAVLCVNCCTQQQNKTEGSQNTFTVVNWLPSFLFYVANIDMLLPEHPLKVVLRVERIRGKALA